MTFLGRRVLCPIGLLLTSHQFSRFCTRFDVGVKKDMVIGRFEVNCLVRSSERLALHCSQGCELRVPVLPKY